MSERQKRADIDTAEAVTRGVNILHVRDRSVAQNYMEYKRVPAHVIERVLDHPSLRRVPSPELARSAAITPLPTDGEDD